MSEPTDFDMSGMESATEGTDAATDAAVPDDASMAEASQAGGGTVTDGLLSTEPDIDARDAGNLLDTEQPWHAHAEVFIRKFMHGFGGVDGSPAVLSLVVAMVALVDEYSDAQSESDDSDSEDTEIMGNIPE